MALNMDAIGKKIGPLKKEYDWRDVVLYALGVGAGADELDYTYEKNLKVIPSFSIAAIFNFLGEVGVASNMNLAGILHGEQELIFHNPIPTSGTLTTEGKITHYYDKGPKGALVVAESDTFHSNGKKLFTNIITVFARLDGGFGGENAPPNVVEFPGREPDFAVDAAPSPNQPLIYRLSGDVFQLHVDPEFARMVGFEKPIMHGLCTHGFACRALMASLTPGRPEQVRRLACRFSKTLYPGDPIRTLIWKVAEGKALWRTINTRTNDTVIDNGVFEYGDVPKDEIRFDGRVAVITGAGGGLGRVYALELAKRGAKVVVNDFGGGRDGVGEGSRTPARKVVDEIQTHGGEAIANYDNVATPEGGEKIVKAAIDAFGTIDILINNAGILRDKSLAKMEPETWQAVLDVHLNGAYHVTRPAFQAMRENNYGRIVMTTSAAGLYGNFGQTNYSSAKLALVGLMNTLRLEGQKYNIKANTIAPVAASRLTEDVMPPDLFEKLKPDYIAGIVAYLCSENCRETGAVFNAAAGYYSRAAILTGPGLMLGDGKNPPTPEDIRDHFKQISSLEGARELQDATVAVMSFMSPPKAEDKQGTKEAGAAPSVKDIFDKMPDAFNAEKAAGKDLIFQFNISGAGGGDWSVTIKDGACRVEAGLADKPTTTIMMAEGDFLQLIQGKLDGMQAFSAGKLKVGGDIMKAQLIGKLFKFKT